MNQEEIHDNNQDNEATTIKHYLYNESSLRSIQAELNNEQIEIDKNNRQKQRTFIILKIVQRYTFPPIPQIQNQKLLQQQRLTTEMLVQAPNQLRLFRVATRSLQPLSIMRKELILRNIDRNINSQFR
ncbi:Hypothetical_protein [Hexamita inflata]|uniref:Hypothetical_protein n=1 Tax=Hexamita inflata TaxID=28002 RepID=A0AA86N4C6_9EUKA|nr:Hypothetical protein HINF_LOCUS247 [Hexamita inflata]CAI9912605.1 Hypothetical protein HINF_LOCUS250 [Hexamita inflata]CAI9964997.1 Hypothetical protein HINF_LOCUS52642 [Hexamita inflata]CAI9965000.1 Hypothetical protein HINF_LOCUS52645 [Hexamita inflata]